MLPQTLVSENPLSDEPVGDRGVETVTVQYKGEHVLVSGNIKAANPTFLEVGLKQRITVAEVGDNGFGDQIVRALVVKAGLCWYKKHFLYVDYRIGKQEFLRV